MIQFNEPAAGIAARVHSAPFSAISVTTSGLRRSTLS